MGSRTPPASPPGHRRGLSAPLWRVGLATAAATALFGLTCQGAMAHLIDEVAESIVVDLSSDDGRVFALAYVLHEAQVEAFYHQARQLDMAGTASDRDFARRLALAFRYDGCVAEPLASPRVDMPQQGFVAYKLTLRCDQIGPALRLRRVDYDRRKTRTTLYISLRVGQTPPRRLLVPPRLAELSLPLAGGAGPSASPPGGPPRRHGKGPGGATVEDAAPDRPGRLPADPIDLSQLPLPGQGPAPTWRRVLRPPPMMVLRAWAEEGATHLASGLDHLLFLLAIAIAALSWRALLAAVVAFSVGHMCAMSLTLALDLPAWPAVEVAIALSICWSGWRARRPLKARAVWTWVGAGAFGLVHGLGFGTGLKALVGGTEGILWPIVSFGVGLDLAQSVWAIAVMAIWTPVRRRTGRVARRLQHGAAWMLVAAGAALALRAALV